jgi:biotin transport system substrate-specific component
MVGLTDLLWAFVGLTLTIFGTFLEAFATSPPWQWFQEGGFVAQSLGVRFQVGAVLLTGCLGGPQAGAIAQVAYLGLGLAGLPIFENGGGFGYVQALSFGYLLGFVPGGWLCGWLAHLPRSRDRAVPGRAPRIERMPPPRATSQRRSPPAPTAPRISLERLTLAAVAGLATIHGVGLTWLLLFHGGRFGEAAIAYSLKPLPGQAVILCAAVTLAALIRRLLLS